ncbi:MAG: hypothetical protein ABI724_10470 [Betaproteobacteria bacterium]
MFAAVVHLSLTTLTDPTKHRAHNAWRQLDYDPELLLQPGVAWSDAWVRSPDCVRASAPDIESAIAGFHYAELCWLRAPGYSSAQSLTDFSECAFQMGRRPDGAWATQALSAYFVPLKGYVNARVLVSAEALPFRPMTGIHLTLSRLSAHDAAAEASFRWHDQVRIPRILGCAEVAGAWTFATRDLFKPERDLSAPALRLEVVYLDGDPLAFAAELGSHEQAWRKVPANPAMTGVEERLLAGPLRTIIPWRWDWFDVAGIESD